MKLLLLLVLLSVSCSVGVICLTSTSAVPTTVVHLWLGLLRTTESQEEQVLLLHGWYIGECSDCDTEYSRFIQSTYSRKSLDSIYLCMSVH